MDSPLPPSLLLPLTLAGCLFIPDSAVEARLGASGGDSSGPDDTGDTEGASGHMPTITINTSVSDTRGGVVPLAGIQLNAEDVDGDLQSLTILGPDGVDLGAHGSFTGEGGFVVTFAPLDPCTRGTPTTFYATAIDAEGRANSQSVDVVSPGQSFDIGATPHVTALPASLCGSLSVDATFTVEPSAVDGINLAWEGWVTEFTATGATPILQVSWGEATSGSVGIIDMSTEKLDGFTTYLIEGGTAPAPDQVWTNHVFLLDAEAVSGVLTLRAE